MRGPIKTLILKWEEMALEVDRDSAVKRSQRHPHGFQGKWESCHISLRLPASLGWYLKIIGKTPSFTCSQKQPWQFASDLSSGNRNKTDRRGQERREDFQRPEDH